MKPTKAWALVMLVPALFLCACTTAYVPVPLRINDAAQYTADLAFCSSQDTLARYRPSLNAGDVAYGGLSGAARNATGGVVGGPLVVGVGAAGGATDALSAGLDAFGKAKANVSRHCLYDETMQDRSAVLARPED